MQDFSNKTLLISGASSEIGTGICHMLAREGARLLLIGRNIEKLTLLQQQLDTPPDEGKEHEIIACDLADVDSIANQLKDKLFELAPFYGFCHVAGVVKVLPLAGSKPEKVAQQIKVNVLAGIELARLMSGRQIIDTTGGAMLFISSVAAQVSEPGQVTYSASKSAINGAVRAMAVELAPKKIRVNTLSPGFIFTDKVKQNIKLSDSQLENIIGKHPLGAGSVDDVANAALFLLNPKNDWITGTDLVIDGGYTAH